MSPALTAPPPALVLEPAETAALWQALGAELATIPTDLAGAGADGLVAAAAGVPRLQLPQAGEGQREVRLRRVLRPPRVPGLVVGVVQLLQEVPDQPVPLGLVHDHPRLDEAGDIAPTGQRR